MVKDEKIKGKVMVVCSDEEGYSFIIGSKNVDCRQIAEKMRNELGARGGGSMAMIQGSVQRKMEEIAMIFK